MQAKRSFNNVNPEEADLLAEYEEATGKKVSRGAGWGNKVFGGTNDAGFREWKKSGMATPQKAMDAGKNRFNAMMANRSQTQAGMSGFDKFQAMQAARDSANYNVDGSSLPAGVVSWADLENGSLENKIRAYNAGQRSEQAARFNAAMGANPLILQQLQMGQRQMGPQFNAFGFGAQPGLAAQGGQGGSMLANISSQGMNQLAAGQQNNPTIFKAKS
mgnify:CR=1 FL=1